MRPGKKLILAVSALALMGSAGCKKKTPRTAPVTQPPTITQPEPEKPPVQTPPETQPIVVVPPATQPEPEPTPAPKPKPRPHKKKTQPSTEIKPSTTKPATTPKPPTDAGKPEGNVQISAEVPQNVVNQRRQQTEDLLNAAEANLKKINRGLTDGEQSMQRQVRNFITQSRLAIQDGDFERAYNLAMKAQQLSQELAK